MTFLMRPRSRARRTPRARPVFDHLEPRITPTTFVWTGAAGDGSWNDPSNWTHVIPHTGETVTGVPTAFSDVLFPATSASSTIDLDFAYIGMPLESLTVAGSYTFDGNPFTIENNLSVLTAFGTPTTATFLNTGLYFAAGAAIDTATDTTLDIANSTDPTGLAMNIAGALTLFGGGQVNVDTGNISYPNTAPLAPTPVEIAGGTFSFGTSESLTGINFRVDSGSSLIIPDDTALQIGTLTGSGTVQLQGATATGDTTALSVRVPYTTSAHFNGLIDGIGQFTNAGSGTFTAANIDFSAAGTIQVTDGTLLVNGPISAGTLTVGPLGSFGGTGTWRFSGAATFQSGATFDITVNGLNAGTQYTQLVDTSPAGVTLDDTVLSGTVDYEFEQGDQYTIIAAPVVTGIFQNVVNGQLLLNDVPFDVTSTTAAVTITAINSATTTNLSSSAPVAHPGQPITFTATVTTRTAAVTSGAVSFLQGGTVVATVPLSANGTAAFTTATLPLGTTRITAEFLGSNNIVGSTSPALRQYVVPYSTSTTLVSTANPGLPGQPVSLVAFVTADGLPVTSGTVTFRRGTHRLGTVALSSSGSATLTISTLAIGKTKIQAIYNGSPTEYSSTSRLLTQSIVPFSTTTSLAIQTTTRTLLEATVLTVGIGQPIPTGTVIFRKNGVIVGRAKLHNGVAILLLPKRIKLTGNFTAAYQGAPKFHASKSVAVR